MSDADENDDSKRQAMEKRSRECDSADEECGVPNKRPRTTSTELAEPINSMKNITVKVTNGSNLSSEDGTPTDKCDEYENGKTKVTNDRTHDKKAVIVIARMDTDCIKDGDEMKPEKKKMKTKEEEPLSDNSKISEVVDGLELSVECASDKEASSSESEEEKNSRPRSKTIIVKAKPNDSELEVGSSEVEPSNDGEDSEHDAAKLEKQTRKKKTLTRPSSSKPKGKSKSNSDDEDYKFQSKNRIKKNAASKKISSQKKKTEEQRGSKEKPANDSEDMSESEDDKVKLPETKTERKRKSAKKSVTDSEGDESESEGEKATPYKKPPKKKPESKQKSVTTSENNKSESEDEKAKSPKTKTKTKQQSKKTSVRESEDDRSESEDDKSSPQRIRTKKKRENEEKSVTDSGNDTPDSEESGSSDETMSLADRSKKKLLQSESKKTEKIETDSGSTSESDGQNDSDYKNYKNEKQKSVNKDPKKDKRIMSLRKYLNVVGIRIKYEQVWAGCKTNAQRVRRLKKLLEDCGIKGRPTLQKCERLKKRNETKNEIAQLDVTNIISSGGRVTRARKAMVDDNSTTKSPDARVIRARIQPVCDSDSE